MCTPGFHMGYEFIVLQAIQRYKDHVSELNYSSSEEGNIKKKKKNSVFVLCQGIRRYLIFSR